MSRRESNALNSRKFLKMLYDRYDGAKVCYGCGCDLEQPEWHHIVPVQVGGTDIPTNIVPLCHACHAAITHMQPVTKYRKKDSAKITGRKAIYPENYKDILEDYTRCRISKSEAAERLGKKSVRFNNERFLEEYIESAGIAYYRNNIDVYMSKHDYILVGHNVGHIEYTDGRTEELYWKAEEPISGESSIPTKTEEEKRKHIHQKAKEAREENHRRFIAELSAAEKIYDYLQSTTSIGATAPHGRG